MDVNWVQLDTNDRQVPGIRVTRNIKIRWLDRLKLKNESLLPVIERRIVSRVVSNVTKNRTIYKKLSISTGKEWVLP